ncbi:MAG TPA: hypothetical protein EYP59_09245 [Thiotrichaceae bacterium]|jgi:hypothetical protein|nr:hypothetical protein [Thiotrichaceae bacterium]
MIDEEIAEIRRIRHQILAKFDHDPRKVIVYYRTLEKEYRESGEFKFAPISALSKSDSPNILAFKTLKDKITNPQD